MIMTRSVIIINLFGTKTLRTRCSGHPVISSRCSELIFASKKVYRVSVTHVCQEIVIKTITGKSEWNGRQYVKYTVRKSGQKWPGVRKLILPGDREYIITLIEGANLKENGNTFSFFAHLSLFLIIEIPILYRHWK